MTQHEYATICDIIQNGAPVLANQLVNSLNTLITDTEKLKTELDTLKSKKKENK